MSVNEKYLNLRTGLKYGALAISISLLFSPILYLLMLLLQAIRDSKVEYWARREPPEFFVVAGIFTLVFFSVPYLLGGCTLGLLVRYFKKISSGLLGLAIGLLSGLMGLFLMALLMWRAESYRTVDWPLVAVTEVWSVILFIWIERRLRSLVKRDD